MVSRDVFDLFVIGGGVNGCGIARDAAGRGYKVGLAEMNDFASGTSSKATKLIHGGLRYLEHYEFRLVREALSERETLLKMAPHIIWPLRFVLPHHRDMRPAWLLRLGLFLYDHIGHRRLLPPTKTIDLQSSPLGAPLKPGYVRGFEYSDCWVNDARLVVLNAKDAKDRGATILPRTRVVSARRASGLWQLELENVTTEAREQVYARILVNAAGPWVDQVLSNVVGSNSAKNVRLVKGSHIVVPKLFEHDRAYIFQNGDGRIIFVIPYEHNFSLIGTTDQDYDGDPKDVRISPAEIAYLCHAASEYLVKPVEEAAVVWAYSGVRPLYDDGASAAQEATRDYVLRVDAEGTGVPLLSIFGGKITTFRRLSEAVLERVEALVGKKGGPWTAGSQLHGGDFGPDEFAQKLSVLKRDYPFLQPEHALRLFRSYGTCAWILLGTARKQADLGRDFGGSLTQREVEYLMKEEWAFTAEDVLWRRSKLGLTVSASQAANLANWMTEHRAAAAIAAAT